MPELPARSKVAKVFTEAAQRKAEKERDAFQTTCLGAQRAKETPSKVKPGKKEKNKHTKPSCHLILCRHQVNWAMKSTFL